jgi:hypothetical protein
MISKSTILVAAVAMATTGASAQRCEDCGPYPIGRKMLQSASEGTASSLSPPAPSPPAPSPPASFYKEGNTIKCPNAKVGDTGVVNGVTYTKRDKSGLRGLANGDSSQLSTSCTTGVVDMAGLWVLTSPAVRSPAPTRAHAHARSARRSLARQVLQASPSTGPSIAGTRAR